VQPDALHHLSRAVERTIEAAALPLLVLLGIALLALAGSWYRDRRRGRQRSGGERVRGKDVRTPPTNGFLRFHRAAEAAGYPALLIVSMVALAMMVVAIVLLAAVQAAWAFVTAILTLIGSLALLAAAVEAAFSDGGESVATPADPKGSPVKHDAPVPLPGRIPASRWDQEGRRAA
jgi:cytochrome bd-type quinol oxidase subunit 2